MPTLIINGEVSTIEQQHFSSFHGNSVFTTLKWSQGQLWYWPEHWQRLAAHANFLSFPMPQEKYILATIKNALKNQLIPQKIRVIVGSSGHAITIEELGIYEPHLYEGVAVAKSNYQVHTQFAHLKTANSLPYALALKEAQRMEVFETLLTNQQGFVVDGSRSSLMLFKNNSLTKVSGGLEGVMRKKALEFALTRRISVDEAFIRYEEIEGQLLLANSLFGVLSVGPPSHPFIKELIEYFRE